MKTIYTVLVVGFVIILSQVNGYAIKIEEAQRAVQERHFIATGNYFDWPARYSDGQTPGNYPEDGFYEEDLSNPRYAADLVADIGGKLEVILGDFSWIDPSHVDLSGMNIDPGISKLFIYNDGLFNYITINSSNYIEAFIQIQKKICELRYIVLTGELEYKKDYNYYWLNFGEWRPEAYPWIDALKNCALEKIPVANPGYTEYRFCEDLGNDYNFRENVTPIGAGAAITGGSSYNDESHTGGINVVWRGGSIAPVNTAKMQRVISKSESMNYYAAFIGYEQYVGPSNYGSPSEHVYVKITSGKEGKITADSDLVSLVSLLQDNGLTGYNFGWNLEEAAAVVKLELEYNIELCESTSCRTCKSGGCHASSGDPNSSTGGEGISHFLSFDIDLGESGDGAANYSIALDITTPQMANYTPSLLTASSGIDAVVNRDTNDAIRQMKAPEVTADVVTVSSKKYQIKFYAASQVSANPNGSGLYTFTGSPIRTWTVENPNADTDLSTVKFTETVGSKSTVHTLNITSATETIRESTLTKGNGLVKEYRKVVFDPATQDYTETLETRNSSNSVQSKTINTYHNFPWGKQLVKTVLDPDATTPLTTTYEFYSDQSADGMNYKKLKQRVGPYGDWDKYEYDGAERVIKHVSSYKNAATNAADNQCRVVTTQYASGDPAITTIETLLGQEVSRQYTVYRPGETREIRAWTPGAAWNDLNNLVTVTKSYLGTEFEGETQSVLNSDGTLTTYVYSKSGNLKTTTVKTGAPNGTFDDVTDGTKTITVTNTQGNIVSESVYDILTNKLLSSQIASAIDEFGRPTTIQYSDGTHETIVYDCCGIESKTDREGITTSYTYDDLKRVQTESRAGQTMVYTYDAVGNVTKKVRTGSSGGNITQDTSTFDKAGRRKSSKNALSGTTNFVEKKNGSGQRVVTSTYPNGKTRIETYQKDGNLYTVRGTGAYSLNYAYGVDASGEYVKETRLGDSGETTEWTQRYTDFLGRTYKTVFPDGGVDESFFNNKGQLIKRSDPDGVITLFQYNPKGELEYTAVDYNKNGVIDLSGTDRVTQVTRSVVAAHGTDCIHEVTKVWTTNNSSSTTTTQTRDVATSGLQSWVTIFGLTTQSSVSYDGAGGRTEVVTEPDGTTTTRTYQDGRLVTEVVAQSSVGTLRSLSFQYDQHGRTYKVTDASTSTTEYGYNSADQVNKVIAPAPDASSSTQTTMMAYDNMMRRTGVTQPDGGLVTYIYSDKGELKNVSGARVYTSDYTYDSQGRMKTLLAGTGTTTWNYSSDRGFLSSKKYADNKGPSYTYTKAGRLKTRTWARGITTTYSYNNAGDLLTTDYSDTTPDVTYSYDRRGRLNKLDGSLETVNLTLHNSGIVSQEKHTNGPLSTMTTTNQLNSLLRRTRMQIRLNNTLKTENGFKYDGASRMLTASNGIYSATYAYKSQSPLVSGITFKSGTTTRITVNKTYDNLNRLKSIQNDVTLAGEKDQNFTYTYNDANQRTRVDLADGSYWIYQYDALGQVTSGKKYHSDGVPVDGQQFGYGFDSIGNRLTSSRDGESATYTPNNLNQYTQRTVPGSVHVMGSAKVDAKVTVNNQPVDRKNEYFHKKLTVSNGSAAQQVDVSVVGVKNNADANGLDAVSKYSTTGVVPKTPELYTYDDDGNILSDGLWTYTWDAENRLTSMERLAPSSQRMKLEFVNDYQSRRIQKKVSTWNGSAYVLSDTRKYLYDGWNLVGEFDGSNNLVQSYVWGLDLSGSEQGAGGVGGLLIVKFATGAGHFVAMDGNGNVSGLIDGSSGKVSAVYEYSPFGETLRSSGAMAKANPFQFSTKYLDQESGFNYYGYRYYNPDAGRWLNRDPVEEADSLNVYSTIYNSMWNYIDVLGREAFKTSGIDGVYNNVTSQVTFTPGPQQDDEVFSFLIGIIDTLHSIATSPSYIQCQTCCSIDAAINASQPIPFIEFKFGETTSNLLGSSTTGHNNPIRVLNPIDLVADGIDTANDLLRKPISSDLSQMKSRVERSEDLLSRKKAKSDVRLEKLKRQLLENTEKYRRIERVNKISEAINAGGKILNAVGAISDWWDCYERCKSKL